ncbi:MAG: glycine dehydrogenase (aminomethyl-transferring) [Piscirickettsiaceae bacterium CG_4_9_14_3_um_filter_43_564]|nr:aminomethyl-transferring glycine dehydrogenase [Thiomicrospira sp.]PIQ04930.1 MAG: glycine dehydrogenase (aminomethyl-transferring) [Piscirickettsiaceae bacterium CG18_big_fil_WC_8_21_14_2_50_44_103]PIW57343.1 MAG: glycine dehydrogenase (aminomethyl-transferring) [Piscirickettsiaceae bacterium CG12_big_fil_rev_8_21_14_0_65_44_934]PIW76902.1 MAG: glycine dehydrogenase (aminomethyl-transferring) [Piscirickettsiaceae bacterium CG_4_8_14_3_um_filter_44_38]PIX80886.1 MAG: glycine dehydrogenase (a
MTQSLQKLINHDVFAKRHIGSNDQQQNHLLHTLGVDSLEAMLDQVVPESIRLRQPMQLPNGLSEQAALSRLANIAEQNTLLKSYIGLGFYNTFTPAVIQRNILENPAWYTAYTPYQAEISQGRLEALLNFQTMIADLTGFALANASMLDEASACAEAMTLCQRVSQSKSQTFFVSQQCHPQNIEVVKTRAASLDIEVVVGHPFEELPGLDVFGALLALPGSNGVIEDYTQVIEQLHQQKAVVAVCADILALTVLKSPAEMGADVAVGNTQRFGVPLGYGGPHAAYMATKDDYKRAMPGRLIGVSLDRHGNRAYRLALQTREQHIRREKATSNICTAQALLAVMASMYAVYHGPEGLTQIANRVFQLTALFAYGLKKLGIEVVHQVFFDTLEIPETAVSDRLALAEQAGFNLRAGNERIFVSFDETTELAELETLWQIFNPDVSFSAEQLYAATQFDLPSSLKRQAPLLPHDVFHRYRSETELMRYMRHLADKDLALDRAMIPLGSCTMKLNAAAELMSISWSAWSGLHPFVPLDQAKGYQQLIQELEQMLCETTGYAAVSLQPNSGAQGEYAGLLAIKHYHQSRNESQRNICLIPASAHGTNPASAHLAGMKVVVVKTDEFGNIDLVDLKLKCEKYSQTLAAMMITYPSTHGVFEESVKTVCDWVHQHGGQVYIDGANMNAMVGVAAPGQFGGDVSHLNLHKTFAIPHGGGGPGVGPVAVASHLAEFLPRTPIQDSPVGAVCATPWGSASILPISWMYIVMMGREGLYQATANAILNANYIAHRLAEHFPILYRSKSGWVAHECIIDLRPLKVESGITVDDVAKRLIDYGFHAPTMSFPVAGTLMIEPTESESQQELDRFCDAMIQIKQEVNELLAGRLDEADNPLINAPHTAQEVMSDEWSHPYSRQLAAYPLDSLRQAKYWSPVGRVDNVYGDKNLICHCPSMADYAE